MRYRSTSLACLLASGVILAATAFSSRRFGDEAVADEPLVAAKPLMNDDGFPVDRAAFDKSIHPFLTTHCIRCHGEEAQEGDLRLDDVGLDFTKSATASKWIEVMDRLNRGEMPPSDEAQPSADDAQRVTGWIAGELRRAERSRLSTGGRVLMRRLNRVEYANTIRDLLAMDFLPGKGPLSQLPPDGTAEGFDKVGRALMLDPSLLDKYYEVAQRVAAEAIVDGPPEFRTETIRMEMESIATNRAIDYLCSRPGLRCRESDVVLTAHSTRSWNFRHPQATETNQPMPTDGRYRISVRASALPGADGKPVVMRVRQGHPDKSKQILLEREIATGPDDPRVYTVVLPRDALGGEIQISQLADVRYTVYTRQYGDLNDALRTAGRNGDFAKSLRLRGRMLTEGLVSGSKPNPDTVDESKLPRLYLDWLEVEGPLRDQWPPKSHEIVLFRGAEAEENADYVRAIFERLLPRAYRRPITEADVAPIVGLVDEELELGTPFKEAVRVGLSAVLTSPHFLYVAEPTGEQSRPLNGYETASRLSYFLWSSMPDDTLFELAAKDGLRDPDVLSQQVDRMLADPRSEALVREFARQWLRTDSYHNFDPDPRLYPDYDEKLGAAMVEESLAFFREILEHDLSVRNFLDSDWTMLNERLAKHYGIDGVKGETFRRVTLPEGSHRGGLLGHAGVLMAGSDGLRTKPVSRGVYVREVLFNDPPNPPPANVGEIEPNIEGERLTVRERLIQHQRIAACAACHRTIDPYGLALENFNVVGAWRTLQDGEDFRGRNRPAINSSGELPNGEAFATVDEFKALLSKQDDRFRRGLVEKLLVYGLGRPVEPTDRTTIDAITARMQADDDTLRTAIKGLVTSRPFLTK